MTLGVKGKLLHIFLYTLVLLNLSCKIQESSIDNSRKVALSKSLQADNINRTGNTILDAPDLIKNYLSNLAPNVGITWNIYENSNSDIVVDISLEETLPNLEEKDQNDHKPLTMFIHDSVHRHELSEYFRGI